MAYCCDIDECTSGKDSCDPNAQCDNTEGGYECECNDGFVGNGKSCTDIDECTSGKDSCDPNAQCDNTEGGYECECNDGFVGNGKSCTAITCDKPEEGTNTEAVPSGPRDRDEVFTYSCIPGNILLSGELETVCTVNVGASTGQWSNDAPTCTVITCDNPREGTNTLEVPISGPWYLYSTYPYTCKPGYTASLDDLAVVCVEDKTGSAGKWSKDPPTCEDIDECTSGKDSCDPNAQCDNTEGGYECECNDGFVGNGKSCTAITCDKPEEGTNTEAVPSGPRDRDEVFTYSCIPGNILLSGELETVCTVNVGASTGQWSNDAPTCTVITCDNPREGTNTLEVPISGPWYLYSTYPYTCKPGYTASLDDLAVVCVEDKTGSAGKWSKDPPTCEAERSSTQGTPLRCPRGFELFEGKYCFLIISKADIWEVQARKCKAKKGQLAIPRSEDKAEVLQRYHTENLRNDVWIGPQCLVVSNVFTDFELNRLSFTYFKNKKPERASGKGQGPDCVSVSAQNGKWTNECCYTRHPAICEIGPIGDPECDDVSGYIFFQDRCLRFITNPDSFEAQCHECRRLKGRLALSLNEAQNEALLAFYKSESPANGKPAWFNLHNLISSSNYQTTELLTSTFSKLPGRSSDSDRCVNIGSGGWGKECCHDKLPAVCELNRCPQHYIQSGDICVRLLQTPDTWEASEKKCRKDGASLVIDGDDQLEELLGSKFLSAGSWIGCHDQVEEENIQTPFLKELGVEINRNNAERDCCVLNSDGVSMECCYEKLRAICSLPLKK
ncbi:uncharacterized protein LOC115927613 [Strongylocentrotus purpuratus]|uniref:Uncharacterized protein n=1 Tax=Strongylocentrotus purpuratus TaxID=7668 RepID=A0A7M7PHV0_STRPU|nr:uncharacterized protein LOC115927613 [Strongylocentrotus purpuratus]